MLHPLIAVIFCLKNMLLVEAYASCHACKGIEDLRQESLQKIELLTKSPAFQEVVKALQNHPPSSFSRKTLEEELPANFYIFVSFSMGERALLNLAQDAKQFGATLVLKGFKDGSYLKTVQTLHKIILKTGQGFTIDPELYSLFNISAVPTFILAKPFTLNPTELTQTPLHDKLQGHVSAQYALEAFAKEGDLKNEAQALLKVGGIK